MATAFDELTKCVFCESDLEDSIHLPCFHTFCKECINVNIKEGKVTCPICKRIYSASVGNVDKMFKQSFLSQFWINWNSEHFENLKLTAEEKTETEGICPECAPVQSNKSKPASSTAVEPEQLLIKLKPCFHCKKNLCESCRNKHYNNQRQETFKILEQYQEGARNIASVSETLNEARLRKIAEYEKLKVEISTKKVELAKKLEQEEKTLIERLENEVKEEREKIALSEHDIKKFTATKEASKAIREKIVVEKDTKKLSEICNEFSKAQNEFQILLTTEAQRIDPSKEKKLNFTPAKLKEEIIGSLEQKKDKDVKAKQAEIPSSKSKICSVM